MVLAATKIVVVLTPPPVPPGEEPMNMSAPIIASVSVPKPARGSVANPDVLATAEWNTAAIAASGGLMSFSALFFSSAKNATEPTTRSITVIAMATFVWRLSLYRLFFSFCSNSFITMNPMPPTIVRIMTVALTTGLLIELARLLKPPNRSNPALLNAEVAWKIPYFAAVAVPMPDFHVRNSTNAPSASNRATNAIVRFANLYTSPIDGRFIDSWKYTLPASLRFLPNMN